MILATHAIVGGAIASCLPVQHGWALVAAATLGFASHFAIDAIPHCDYPLRSDSIRPRSMAPLRLSRNLALDLATIGFDAALGIALALVLFLPLTSAQMILTAAVAGMLPDPLQFLHSRFPREPLVSLQRIHVWIHTDIRLSHRSLAGPCSQLLFAATVVAASYAISAAIGNRAV